MRDGPGGGQPVLAGVEAGTAVSVRVGSRILDGDGVLDGVTVEQARAILAGRGGTRIRASPPMLRVGAWAPCEKATGPVSATWRR